MRLDLEHYVATLKSRRGDDGSHLVVFPRNYQQVLSLMSERDVRDEDAPFAATSADSSLHNQQSWSRVLLQAGLSKQQAFVSRLFGTWLGFPCDGEPHNVACARGF